MATIKKMLGMVHGRLGNIELAASLLEESKQLANQLPVELVDALKADTEISGALFSNHMGNYSTAFARYKVASIFISSLIDKSPEYPELTWSLAKLRYHMGTTFAVVGDQPASTICFEQARAIMERLVEHHADVVEFQIDLAAIYRAIGEHQLRDGEGNGARHRLRDAAAIYDKLTESTRRKGLREAQREVRELEESLDGAVAAEAAALNTPSISMP